MRLTLQNWLSNGWLKHHVTSKQEISNLFSIVKRDIKDAGNGELSSDWRFGIACNAALKLCKILLGASGYRTESRDNHYRTISSLTLILGNSASGDADYLNSCRMKRNTLEYDLAGAATEADVKELIEFVKELKTAVLNWLSSNHPEHL